MASLIADPLRAARLILSLRRRGITDDAVLSALETVDRGAFVADSFADMAIEDCAVPIPCGQAIPKPLVTAKLLRNLQIPPSGELRVLLVGLGSGYTAALLSQMTRHVYGVERYRALAGAARSRFEALKVDNVTVRHGDGLVGWPEHGPYDRILLAGIATTVPAALLDQLTKDGLLVGVITGEKGENRLRTYSGKKIVSDERFSDTLGALSRGIAQSL